jgi:formate hydrogenlyase subunit 6/NADH:ubiquinone oxidoreductase subunit I
MTDKTLLIGSSVSLPKSELDLLLADLRSNGFQTVGPHLQDESIIYTQIEGLKDLPRGILSEQKPASYRMIQTGLDRYFDFIPGGQSWKQFLFPPHHNLFTAVKNDKWQLITNDEAAPHYAFVGVRACELAAINIQDKIFLRDDFTDPIYRPRREGLFILAVNCLDPDATCFCVSMGTGPRHSAGFDLCVTELDEVFLVEVGSELGRSLLAARIYDLPSAFVQNAAKQAMESANKSMIRSMDTSDLPKLLTEHLDVDRWTEVGKRCLSCANCTQVCPTCFCWDANDQVDILGKTTRRERVWDSCFNPIYSYVVGGNTRPNIRSRYRQWLTHKLGTWKDQFGVLGCVGCGRCITWCPAGIDLTEEVAAIRAEVKA